jgi:hypothetical protein
MNEQSRPTRAEEARQERRRQRGATSHPGIKLGVNEAFLDREKYEYRWINDNGGRILDMTQNDDWDLVSDPSKKGKTDADGEGALISKVVGTGEFGKPLRAFLARKPKEFYAEDQAAKAKSLDATMDSLRRGLPQTTDGDFARHGYVPGGPGSIQITETRR